MTKAATDFRVRGLVQGVGFRPTVYRIARELGLSGTVWNDAEGVVVHLEGESEVLERFPEALFAGKPPLARIDAVEPAPGELQGMEGFSISLLRLDDELKELLDAKADTPAFKA